MPRTDEVITRAAHLLLSLGVRRCRRCGFFDVWNGTPPPDAPHARCGGPWDEFGNQSARTLVLTFLSRQMLA